MAEAERAPGPGHPYGSAHPYGSVHPHGPGPAATEARYFGPFGGPQDSTWILPAHPVVQPASTARARKRLGAGPLLALAAATALVVGGGAGYGGALLAERQAPTSVSAPAPTTDPTTGLPQPTGPVTGTVDVAKRLIPSTVMIEVGDATGSGFVLDGQGHLMTNNHVVAGADDGDRIRVVFADGRRTGATLVGRSPSYDLAVIKVQPSRDLRPVQVGRSAQVQVGQEVVAIGSPLGLPGTVTQGIVSARDRPLVVNESSSADTPSAYINGIQTDAPINPGNSGGPLIDASARVIGVNSAILTMGESRGQAGNIGLGFAIPIDQAMTIGRQLITNGKATYPVIGANVANTSDGVRLSSVDTSGPAGRAGLRAGDVVTRLDGKTVREATELIVGIRTHRPGEAVTLDYTRGPVKRQVRVTLGGKEG